MVDLTCELKCELKSYDEVILDVFENVEIQ